MRRGTTLLELLAALTVLAVLAGMAIPAMARARDRALVVLHARHLAAAHGATRSAARLAGARAALTVTPTAYAQERWDGSAFQPAWSRPGPATDGITLTGPSTPMVFDSRGYTLGAANRTYQLTRGTATRRVIISRLGRLRIVP